jgi:purine catabolism regulator
MSITVRQALQIGGLQHGELLAGAANLDRPIHQVNILEAPWEPFWQTKDQLFLTSFYAMRDDIPLQIENIAGLAANGCAGLVFQTGIQDKLDPAVIEKAEEVGLPLIVVDEAIDYPIILAPLVQAISREKGFLLQRSQEIHKRLTGLLLGEAGLTAVAAALHELIAYPVAFCNSWGEQLAAAGPFPAESSDAIFPVIEGMLDCKPQELTWQPNLGAWLAPLWAGTRREIDGFVVVHDPERQANELDLTAVEQAALVASLELAKQHAVLETERRLKRDFLEDMLSGEYRSTEALVARGRSLGWDLTDKRVVMLVDLNQFEAYYLRNMAAGESHFQQLKQNLLRAVSLSVKIENSRAIVIERGDSVVVMPHFPHETPLSQIQRAVQGLAEKICAAVPDLVEELSVSVAIGGFYNQIADLRHSFHEATAALAVRKYLSQPAQILWYDDVALHVLLERFSNQAEVGRWLDGLLGRLITYDANNDTELVRSLEAYFDANQNSQQAARDLFVHPKTLKYRLRRIAEILGLDPFAGDRQLAFYLAVKLHRLQD